MRIVTYTTLPPVTTTPTSDKSVLYCVRFDDLTPYKINRLKNRFESNFLSLIRSVDYDTILRTFPLDSFKIVELKNFTDAQSMETKICHKRVTP